jgi:tetratricopeptide (TPR) repeat protein
MDLRITIAVVFLTGTALPLSADDTWRSLLAASDELKSQGRFAEAERKLWSALDEARRLAPDLAPAAATYHELAGLFQDTGRCDSAAGAYERSLALWEKVGPRGDVYLFRTANHLVGCDLQCGAAAAAERHHRTFVAPRLAPGRARDRDPDVAQALINLGSLEYLKRQYSAARAHYEEALAIRERVSAAPSPDTAVVLSNLAFALVRAGEVERALAASRRAIEMAESAAGPSDPLLVSVLVNGAEVHAMARRWSDGEPLIVRALTISRSAAGEEQPLTALVMSRYAALLKRSDRKREAVALENHAREIRSRFPASALQQTVDVRELSGVLGR